METPSFYKLAPYRKTLGMLTILFMIVGTAFSVLVKHLVYVESIPSYCMGLYAVFYLVVGAVIALSFTGAIIADDEISLERRLQKRFPHNF